MLTNSKLADSLKLLERPWTFLLYDAASPNAFVTALLPGRVFVASSLLDSSLCSSDDELAMVRAGDGIFLPRAGRAALRERTPVFLGAHVAALVSPPSLARFASVALFACGARTGGRAI
jgi:hypothetical protein